MSSALTSNVVMALVQMIETEGKKMVEMMLRRCSW